MKKYVVALDQGTSSSRAIVFDSKGNMISVAQKEFTQYFPEPGWVEHDAVEIWESEREVFEEAVCGASASAEEIAAIGITNQRETTVVWDAATGKPICKAIVWQDRRTSEYCKSMAESGLVERVRRKTGLIIDSYFSGTKIRWILDNVPDARQKAERGELRFGNVDSWLVWNLTGGKVHITDVTNASRTMLFNINTLSWDEDLLQILDIPVSMMPEVRSSSEVYGYTELLGGRIPVSGIAGDQQSALFGQMCTDPGAVKNTYGTGCFLLMNTGNKPVFSNNNLLTTIAWKIGNTVNYALEGSIFVAGSVVQWLRDGLGIIKKSSDVEELAKTVSDNGGVYFVPALTGLGAPYWDPYARGSINGITRGTTAGHIARAALEGIAFQTMDIVEAMEKDSGVSISELKVDGGASEDNLLMQFQSDILDTKVVRPLCTETTAMGAAFLAGLAAGFWKDIDEIRSIWQAEKTFEPSSSVDFRASARKGWHNAVKRTLTNSK